MNQNKASRRGLGAQCAYGSADIYGGGAFVVISTFFTVFLTKALGMPTALAGTIPLIGKIWDAVTDPLMGNICDRTRSRFGAKRFYILVGSGISAVTFILMWVVFPSGSMMGLYWFYLLMYVLFSTGFTIVMVPYNALLPDMVEDYTLRSRFSGVRMVFSAFGAILAGLIPTLLIRDNTDASAYLTVGLIFGVIFFVVILITFFGTWERSREPIRISFAESFVQSLTVYKSRCFRIFIVIFLCGQAAADFVTGLAVYYVDDVLNAYGGGRFTYLMAVILLSQFAGTILFTPVMAKTSKQFPVLVGSPLRIAATLALLLFSHEGASFGVILALSFVVGLGMAGSTTTIYALLADMADVDELITSISRPGTCSAMATFVRKIAAGVSSAAIGILLGMVGYSETIAAAGGRQSAATQAGIAWIYVLAPVVLITITLIFACIYPMRKAEFDVIQKEIARRKGEEPGKATPQEIAICEKVTGYAYDQLWKRENALKLR